MISPDDALRDFIRDYYYGECDSDIIAKDADALLKWMQARGWYFERINEPQLDAAQ